MVEVACQAQVAQKQVALVDVLDVVFDGVLGGDAHVVVVVGVAGPDKRAVVVVVGVVGVDVDLGCPERIGVSHLERAGVKRHVPISFVRLGREEGAEEFRIKHVPALILEDLVDSIGDLVIPKEIVLDVVCLVCIVLGQVGQLGHEDVLLVGPHSVDLLLLAQQKLAVFLHTFLLCDGVQAIVLGWEVDPP